MTVWLRQQPTITLDLAIQGMQAATEQAQLLNIKVSLIIVDAGGMTVHMCHMDGAPRPSQAIALNKALTAAGFARSTSEWTDRLKRCSAALQSGLPLQPGMALFGGGEPFLVDGEIVGAIGVSGASEDNDTLCEKQQSSVSANYCKDRIQLVYRSTITEENFDGNFSGR